MRTRYKILILLITATVGLGSLIFLYSTDDALHRFRSLLFKDPRQLLAEVTLSAGNAEGLGYGAIAFFAMLVIGLAIKMARDGEFRAFSDRLVELQVAKAELETLLQDSLWKEKHAREGKDAAMKDLEASVSRLVTTENQIAETENLLQARDREIEALRLQMSSLSQKPNRAASAPTPEESSLREELRRKSELVETKDAAINQLQKQLLGKVHALETQQNLKEKLLKERDVELEALKAQLTKAATAKNQAEHFLAEELRKEKQALLEKDAAIKELEKNLSGKVHALAVQLTQKEELWQVRNTEMEALRGDVKALTRQLADTESAKARAEHLLQQELESKTELLQAKDAAFKELRENSSATIDDLEKQLSQKEAFFKDRNAELETLKAELTRSGTAKNQAESFLTEELRKQRQALEAKQSAMKELEKNLTVKLHLLNVQLIDKQELLQVRSTEIEALRAEVNAMSGRLAEAVSAKTRAEHLLQQELKKTPELLSSKDAAFKELHESSSATIQNLEKQLSEKEALLGEHNAELDGLRTQLSKVSSAKNESEDSLRDEITKMKGLFDAKNSTIRELEQSVKQTVDALESQAAEQESLLKKRDRELQALRSEVENLKAQPAYAGSVNELTPRLLPPELPQGNTMSKLEESSKRVRILENLLSEKEDLLKIHDEKITRLESELKAKRTELARHEITVWQSIERRDLWKRRLAKFGIPLKQR
jgi:chromosome segregation ATPase